MGEPARVTDLTERRDRARKAVEAALPSALDEARGTFATAFFDALGSLVKPGSELRLVICATWDEPDDFLVSEALFFALNDQLPVDPDHRFRLALGAVKAASPEDFERMTAALEVANVLDALRSLAADGVDDARQLLAKLDHLVNFQPESPDDAGDPNNPGDPS